MKVVIGILHTQQSFHTTPYYVNTSPLRDLMMFAVHTVLGSMPSRFACCATPIFFIFRLPPPYPQIPQIPAFVRRGSAIASLRNP